MGDEHQRQRHAALEIGEQRQHLRLDGDVQRRDRLVGDDDVGIERQRPGDADALALAAGELVRIALESICAEPDQRHQFAGAALGLGTRDAMGDRPVSDDPADALARIERGIGVLEDHLDLATKRPQRLAALGQEIDLAEPDRACIRRQQTHQALADGRLAGAGFPDDAERLAAAQREADIVGGRDRALGSEQARPADIGLAEALDAERDRPPVERGRRRRRQRGHRRQ